MVGDRGDGVLGAGDLVGEGEMLRGDPLGGRHGAGRPFDEDLEDGITADPQQLRAEASLLGPQHRADLDGAYARRVDLLR